MEFCESCMYARQFNSKYLFHFVLFEYLLYIYIYHTVELDLYSTIQRENGKLHLVCCLFLFFEIS